MTNEPEAARDAERLLRTLIDPMLDLAERLVGTDTVNVPPHGKESAGQDVLRQFLKSYDVRCEEYDLEFLKDWTHPGIRRDRDYTGRRNLSARVPGSGRGRSLLLNGHMDTVPPGRAAWTDSPWSGMRRGTRLYGLGSFDMKAGLAAQAAVMAALAAADVRLPGDILFESVADEEWGGGGGTLAARLRSAAEPRPDAAIICEGTQLDVLRATRGGYVVDLVVEAGDPTGYFSREEVISPAVALGRLLQWVDGWAVARRQLRSSGAYADAPDPAPVQVLAVEANRLDPEVPLSVPLRGTVRVYFQFLPSEDVAAVLAEIRGSLGELASGDPFFRTHPIEWKPLYDPPLLGHELDEQHAWTRCLRSAVAGARGVEPLVAAAPYPCDAFLLQREFGIPTLLFGPCGAGAHNPDEYVDISSLRVTAEAMLAAALVWCSE